MYTTTGTTSAITLPLPLVYATTSQDTMLHWFVYANQMLWYSLFYQLTAASCICPVCSTTSLLHVLVCVALSL